MDWTFLVKRKEPCPSCSIEGAGKGAGYLPYDADTGSLGNTTIELMCKTCKGQGEVWVKHNLPLESLKDLLK